MDEFANEYFAKITKISSDFENRRRDLAKSRIKLFVAAVSRQLLELNKVFDVIVGAGNSGLFMTKIAEMTYKKLNIDAPLILNLPIYKFKNDTKTPYDNSFLVSNVSNKLFEVYKLNDILFVDDEIMQAITAKESFNLILQANKDIEHLNGTIIAENHFFEWHYDMPKVSIKFFAYAPLIQGLNGNIGYFIPDDLFKKISSIQTNVLSHNHAMAIIIGGALKKIGADGKSYFDFTIENDLKKQITDYETKKTLLVSELSKIVNEGVAQFKTGEIKFRF